MPRLKGKQLGWSGVVKDCFGFFSIVEAGLEDLEEEMDCDN